jgi:hypothetical protein
MIWLSGHGVEWEVARFFVAGVLSTIGCVSSFPPRHGTVVVSVVAVMLVVVGGGCWWLLTLLLLLLLLHGKSNEGAVKTLLRAALALDGWLLFATSYATYAYDDTVQVCPYHPIFHTGRSSNHLLFFTIADDDRPFFLQPSVDQHFDPAGWLC